ncbi:MAG: hypothetical protein U1F43_27975 [Myxococcota bacterium]
MSEVTLTGLDGSNPLGLLAALGVLEATAARGGRLSWRDEGVWRPVLHGVTTSMDELLALLDADRQACIDDPALALAYAGVRDLKPPPAVYRAYLEGLVARSERTTRRAVDWAAAFATDVVVDNNGNTKPTALHFTAGKQLWLKMVVDLVGAVGPDDLRAAIVGPGRYTRERPVWAWDATASRDYALRASNPATEKKTGVPGADWLGVRGLASVGVVPRGSRIVTTGCSGEWKTGHFTWPLWSRPLTLDLARTTLRLLRPEAMTASERAARGIETVLRSGIRRSDQGGYGSFTPALVL